MLVSEQGQQSSSNSLTCPNSISRLVHRCSQPSLRWTSHSWDRASTSLLVTIKPQLQRVLRSCTSLLGMALHYLQERNANSDAVVKAQLTHLISRDDQAQEQRATSNQDACVYDTRRRHSETHDWWKMPQVVHQCTA